MMSSGAHIGTARRADIQGLRAIAVLIVVLHHADLGFSGGFVGVDVFFVISGFVITQLLWREHSATGRVSLLQFYVRRAKRILPALAVMLFMVLLTGAWLTAYGAQPSTARTGAAAALFNANNYLAKYGINGGYFALTSKSNPLLHTWSLSVEEQFYFVFPALLMALFRLGRASRRSGDAARASRLPFFLGLTVVAAISFVASLVARRGMFGFPSSTEVTFYLAPFRVWEFAIGALVAGFVMVKPAAMSAARPLLSAAGFSLVASAALIYDDGTVFPDLAVVLPVAGAAMLLVGGLQHRSNPVSAVLETRAMQWLGDRSYSWYLWHWPFIVFARAMWPEVGSGAAMAAVISLVPAAMSYRYVETPVRVRSFRRRRTVPIIAAVCLVAPLVAGAGMTVQHDMLADSSAARPFSAHLDNRSGCESATPLDERATDSCLWQVPEAVGELLLVGDSNAGQFTEPVLAAAQALHLDVRVATMTACPFIEVSILERGRLDERCARFVAGALRWIEEHHPTIVVIANASDIFLGNDDFQLALGEAETSQATDGFAEQTTDKNELWAAAFGSTLERVDAAGAQMLVVHPVPKFPDYWPPRAMAPLRLLLDPTGYSPTTDRSGAMTRRAAAMLAEAEAATAAGAAALDVFDRLCPEATCRTYLDGEWVYRDAKHITVAAALALTPEFQQALSDLLTASGS